MNTYDKLKRVIFAAKNDQYGDAVYLDLETAEALMPQYGSAKSYPMSFYEFVPHDGSEVGQNFMFRRSAKDKHGEIEPFNIRPISLHYGETRLWPGEKKWYIEGENMNMGVVGMFALDCLNGIKDNNQTIANETVSKSTLDQMLKDAKTDGMREAAEIIRKVIPVIPPDGPINSEQQVVYEELGLIMQEILTSIESRYTELDIKTRIDILKEKLSISGSKIYDLKQQIQNKIILLEDIEERLDSSIKNSLDLCEALTGVLHYVIGHAGSDEQSKVDNALANHNKLMDENNGY